MKNWRKVLALVLVFAMVLACSVTASAATNSAEEVVNDTEDLETPRNETLYIGGLQKTGSSNNNCFAPSGGYFAIAPSAAGSREFEFETLYMFNMLDGKYYPLLASDDYSWNEDKTELTVPLKDNVTFNDGTPMTAADVVATWDTHVEMQTNAGVDYGQYVESMEAVDDYTVLIKAKADNNNPLKVQELVGYMYINESAYLDAQKEAYPDSESFKTAEMFDAPHTGPYTIVFHETESKVIYQRDDNYWGQADNMFGELPHPTYIAAGIYSGNDTENTCFQNGEIDVSQSFISNVWTMWEDMDLPVSTYLDDFPYHLDASMPTIWFNCQKETGINEAAVRKAIAMAVDYDQIITSAMSGYSYTFAEIPHAITGPLNTDLYEKCCEYADLESLNYAGKDVEGAIALLDEAGIVDSDGDGWREYNGEKMSFTVECPTGWTDWNAACEIVAAAGQDIGVEITTYFPEYAVYSEDLQTGNYDCIMYSCGGVGISQPWAGAYTAMYGWGGDFPERITNGYARWYNEEVDELLAAIPSMDTDSEEYYQAWARLNEIYLTEVPCFAVMYRPQWFYQVNETVWTGFPEADDGSNVGPSVCADGYGIWGLYMIELVEG